MMSNAGVGARLSRPSTTKAKTYNASKDPLSWHVWISRKVVLKNKFYKVVNIDYLIAAYGQTRGPPESPLQASFLPSGNPAQMRVSTLILDVEMFSQEVIGSVTSRSASAAIKKT